MARVWNRIASLGDKCSYTMSQSPVKEACAEFFGTFALVLLGDGVMANCVLGRLYLNSVITGALGWGLSVMVAVAIAGGVSGGHVNPAVTTGLASVKKCSLKHMVSYMVAQYIGSFLAAGVVYLIYIDAIEVHDGGLRQIPPSVNATAQIFATYPQDFTSSVTCFLDQVVATALLLIVICAATDSKNLSVPAHSQPMIIGLGIAAVILAFGHNTGAPLNPARDFAPRFFTAISGWGKNVFSYRNYEWFWIPVIAPHVGGVIGAWLYRFFIEMPSESHDRTLREREDCILPDGERQFNRLEAKNASVDIPVEDGVFQHVIDKVVHDSKIGGEAGLQSDLIKQNV